MSSGCFSRKSFLGNVFNAFLTFVAFQLNMREFTCVNKTEKMFGQVASAENI